MQIKDVIRTDEFLKANLQQLEAINKSLNAIVSFADLDQSIAAANDDNDALLYKVPVVLKDNITTKGLKTTGSSNILDNYVPVFDATVTKKIQAAGGIIMGKASMDELGMGGTGLNAHTGAVHNPYDLKRITGGSSSGSAAVVASGCTPLSIGTDTGDSIRKPAALCGVVGVKPTYGRISRYGVIPYASSLDHVGYFTTSVEDAALALEVLAGRDELDMTSSFEPVKAYRELLNGDLASKRIGIIDNVEIKDSQVQACFDDLIKKMEANGALIEKVHFNEKLMKALLPVYLIISNAEATSNHSNLDGIRFGKRVDGNDLDEIMTNSRSQGFSNYVKKRFIIGSYSLYTDNQEVIFRKAQKVRRLIVDELKNKLVNFDALIAMAAVDIANKQEDCNAMHFTAENEVNENHLVLANFSGYPSMTLPCGFKDGMPLGVNLLCKPFDEELMFNIAKGIEDITGLKGIVKEVK